MLPFAIYRYYKCLTFISKLSTSSCFVNKSFTRTRRFTTLISDCDREGIFPLDSESLREDGKKFALKLLFLKAFWSALPDFTCSEGIFVRLPMSCGTDRHKLSYCARFKFGWSLDDLVLKSSWSFSPSTSLIFTLTSHSSKESLHSSVIPSSESGLTRAMYFTLPQLVAIKLKVNWKVSSK